MVDLYRVSGPIPEQQIYAVELESPRIHARVDSNGKQNFDIAKQDELLAQAHALIVDDAVLVWVVHDTNPHALSPKVKKFVQAQHWFQDLTTIGLE